MRVITKWAHTWGQGHRSGCVKAATKHRAGDVKKAAKHRSSIGKAKSAKRGSGIVSRHHKDTRTSAQRHRGRD